MGTKRSILRIEGMTCPSCAARVRSALAELPGVGTVSVDLAGATAAVEHDVDLAGEEDFRAALEGAGYALGKSGAAGLAGALPALGLGLLLSGAYLAASAAGFFNAIPRVDAALGYGALFLVGLLSSVHCVAMCGGIALSQSIPGTAAERAGKGGTGRLARLEPGLLYNLGRVLAYTLIGGLAGALGSAFDFSSTAKGAITALAALLMLGFGLRSLGLLPRLPRLPGPRGTGTTRLGAAASRLAAYLRRRGPFAVGLLNGLIPCGPLQTMQLYALGAGGFLAGALSLFAFSLGTVPLLLGFGLAAALLPRRALPFIRQASAVLVIVLAFVTFGRAAALAGIPLFEPGVGALSLGEGRATRGNLPATEVGLSLRGSAGPGTVLAYAGTELSPSGTVLASETAGKLPAAKLEEGFQSITTEFRANAYQAFAVQVGIPVKWTIRIRAQDLNGCNNPVIVPAFKLKKVLVPGDNLVEFTPTAEGVIPYSCWMGMIRSRIVVVPSLAATDKTGVPAVLAGFGGSADPGAATETPSCCCSRAAAAAASGGTGE
ncbi:MAG: sulfite exporter TauE/SafE family protein [Spirochaetaceae bacterium]|nr:sulfite exporter TauE/SafE family protein [Spirochaetaceae bacterium]